MLMRQARNIKVNVLSEVTQVNLQVPGPAFRALLDSFLPPKALLLSWFQCLFFEEMKGGCL